MASEGILELITSKFRKHDEWNMGKGKIANHLQIIRDGYFLKHFKSALQRRLIKGRLRISKNRQIIFNIYRDLKVILRKDDHLILWAYMYGLDKKMIETIENILKPGDTVVDIGAHKGLYSLICSALVEDSGTVFSFEPVPLLFKGLKEHADLNMVNNIFGYQCAVGKESRKAPFYISNRGGDEWSSLYRWNLAWNKGSDVEVINIDNWIKKKNIKKIDLLKVDAEGSEMDIIIGAEKTLGKGMIKAIIMEFNPATQMAANMSCRELYEVIRDKGYRWYQLPFKAGREIDGEVNKLNGLCDLIAISKIGS
jgi:FkbM family methyltransferase